MRTLPAGRECTAASKQTAALAMAAQIQPLDANGNPNAATGKIVMISVGMSNTTQEFASAGTGISRRAPTPTRPRIRSSSSSTARRAARMRPPGSIPSAPTWTTVNNRLSAAGVTPSRCRSAGSNKPSRGLNNLGAFPAHAQTLQNDLAIIARNLKTRFPNIKICYFASRTRAYTNVATSLNPEPFAYEGGFSAKWLIEDQIAGRGNLNWDVGQRRRRRAAPLLGAISLG